MIIALQYYEGDLDRTMRLARFLADLEEQPTSHMLALVRQPDTPLTPLTKRTLAHCQRVFEAVDVLSPFGAHGHPEACTALWKGTIHHFYQLFQQGRLKHDCIFTLDGGDGTPLHRGWLSLAEVIHDITLKQGKFISGTPYFIGTCPLHVNPNAIFQLEVFGKTKLLSDFPKYDGTLNTHFDIYHRDEMLEHTALSSIVQTDWQGVNPSTDLLHEKSRQSLWLHGYKDPDLIWNARKVVFQQKAPTSIPLIQWYSKDQLKMAEKIRRDFERSLSNS